MHQSRVEAVNFASDDIRSPGRTPEINVDPAERGISIIAGAALLFSGLRRQSLPFLVGGGALLYRGVSGVCPVCSVLQSSAGAPLKDGLQAEATTTARTSPTEACALWRRVEDLPRCLC